MDAIGDACDMDIDNDLIENSADPCPYIPFRYSADPCPNVPFRYSAEPCPNVPFRTFQFGNPKMGTGNQLEILFAVFGFNSSSFPVAQH